MSTLSSEATNLNWLVVSFVDRVPGVVDAIVVSADGLLVAMSNGISRAGGDQFAAVASGLVSLGDGAARCLGGGGVEQLILELEHGYMIFMTIGQGAALAAVADKPCDVGYVIYEMTLLGRRVGSALTPALVAELQATLSEV